MAQFFSTIGRHLECAIQTELVVELELALIERKQCRRFREGVKTFIYDFPKLDHSSPNSFGANVHLRQLFLKTVKVIERSRDVTPRSAVEKSKGLPKVPLCTIYVSYGILKKMAHAFFF